MSKDHHIKAISKPNNSYSGTIGEKHDLYLVGRITEAEDYVDWLYKIRNASRRDVINIHINSPGGDMHTMGQLVDAIHNSEAHIVAYAEGQCLSAATMIFLAADTYYISPFAAFMFHTYSMGIFGKSSDIEANFAFKQKYVRKIFDEYYSEILTEEELQRVIDGTDLWLDADEMAERIKTRNEARKLEIEKLQEEDKKPKKKATKKRAAKKTGRSDAK